MDLPLRMPVYKAAVRQPHAVDIRPDLHLNILIASMVRGGAERVVHDLLTGLGRQQPTGKLFLMHDLAPAYAVTDSERFRLFRLAKLEQAQKLAVVAMEVLASPIPLLYTHLIRASDLRYLWSRGVLTIPVIHNSQPGWHDPPTAYDDPHVPFIVAVSESVAQQLREAGCPKPVIVIRHELQRWPSAERAAQNREAIRKQYGIRPDTLLIGMVGQFKSHKAYTRAVRVLHALQRFRRARLMILGGWDHSYGAGRVTYTAVCRLGVELGVIADMLMPGSVADVEPYYDAFDVFLNTSIYEGLSISTLEAVQHGCPIVTADAAGQREAVPDDAVVVSESSDVDAYVRGILAVTSRRTTRAALPPPPTPALVPMLWTLLARYGVEQAEPRACRVDTLFVTSNLNPGGAQRSLTNLLTHMPDHRSLVCVLGGVTGEHFLSQLAAAGVPVTAIAPSGSLLDRAAKLLALVAATGARTVCFWNAEAVVKLIVAKVLACRDVRIVDVSPGPMLFAELAETEQMQRRIAMSAQQYLDRVDVFVSKYADGGPPPPLRLQSGKLRVIRNGIPAVEAPGEPKSLLPAAADPALAIVTTCRIVPNKRIEFLIDMLALLTPRFPGVTLTVVGGVDKRHAAYWETIEQRIAARGVTNIYFAGPHSDSETFLGAFRVFVMISNAQGCPNASLEAMRAGLPVVANADGGTAEQIVDGVNGFLISGDDPAEMADQVSRLLADTELRDRLGSAARRMVLQTFSMRQMVDGYREVLDAGEIAPPQRALSSAQEV